MEAIRREEQGISQLTVVTPVLAVRCGSEGGIPVTDVFKAGNTRTTGEDDVVGDVTVVDGGRCGYD